MSGTRGAISRGGPSAGCQRNPPSAKDTPIVSRIAVTNVTLSTDMRDAVRAKTEVAATGDTASAATAATAATAAAPAAAAGSPRGIAITGTGTVLRSIYRRIAGPSSS